MSTSVALDDVMLVWVENVAAVGEMGVDCSESPVLSKRRVEGLAVSQMVLTSLACQIREETMRKGLQ